MLASSNLYEPAKATADLLIQAVLESKLIENIWSAYEQVCNETLARFGVQPRKLGEDDCKRILFELACFSAFLIMGQEVPKFIVRKRFLLGNAPDAEGVRYYNGKLLECLESHFESAKFGTVLEVTITAITPDIQFGLGEPLNVPKRIASYVKLGSSVEGAKLFAQYLAYAIDSENYVAIKIIGMNYVESIVGVVRLVLKTVFAKYQK